MRHEIMTVLILWLALQFPLGAMIGAFFHSGASDVRNTISKRPNKVGAAV